jgi:hypothetical protein
MRDDDEPAPNLKDTLFAEEGHSIYQINSNGKSTRISFERTAAKFKYSFDECRFKKID